MRYKPRDIKKSLWSKGIEDMGKGEIQVSIALAKVEEDNGA